MKAVFPDGEREPPPVVGRHRQNRFSGRDHLAGLRDQQSDDPVGRGEKVRLGELRLEIGDLCVSQCDLSVRDDPFLARGAGSVARVGAAGQFESGLGLAKRGGVLIELLLADEILGGQRRRPVVLQMGKKELASAVLTFWPAMSCSSLRTPA